MGSVWASYLLTHSLFRALTTAILRESNRYIMYRVTVMLMFASILLHELGHSVVHAIKNIPPAA